MPSQIKVDEIKNVAGQYEIKTNTFKGQTTAGSIAVQGEGTNTTNLQQGLTKAWGNLNSSSFGLRDSFNFASATDHSAGTHTVTYTTAMANTNYCVTGAGSDGRNFYVRHSQTYSTAAFKMTINERSDNSLVDADYVGFDLAGDLA